MTDAEFVEELAERLNLFLQADPGRANAALLTPMSHAGYASVGHLLGQFCLPRGINPSADPATVENVKFLVPVIEDRRIVKFEAVTGQELQERHRQMAEAVAAASAQGGDAPKE